MSQPDGGLAEYSARARAALLRADQLGIAIQNATRARLEAIAAGERISQPDKHAVRRIEHRVNPKQANRAARSRSPTPARRSPTPARRSPAPATSRSPAPATSYIMFFSKSADPLARYLSNFAPASVEYLGVTYPSIEHAFQAAKYHHSNRPGLAARLAAMSAAEAKSAGSRGGMQKQGAVLDVPRWNAESVGVMKLLVRQRMKTDPEYRRIIEAGRRAGTRFLHFERSGAKSVWGGNFPKGASRDSAAGFVGQNLLGRILDGAAV